MRYPRSSTLPAIEDFVSISVLALMSLLPLIEIIARKWLGGGVPGSIVLVQHLTLWIAILGASLAARSQRLLALSTQSFLPKRFRPGIHLATSMLASAVTGMLLLSSLDMLLIERRAGDMVAWGIPVWVALAIMPAGFLLILGRLIWQASKKTWGRGLATLGLIPTVVLWVLPSSEDSTLLLPALAIIAVATVLGMPIFAALGGAALLLFWADGTPFNAVPGESYRLTTNAMLPAIPLFALGGYILAEGGASRRLTRLFTAVVGWMPGGLAIVTTVVLAFFTPLTGASGVTILSMGGLLLPVLVKARYPYQTSVGLLTVSGSIGLLFFPSLPVFMYAFYANLPYEQLFIGGILPGMLLVVMVASWAGLRGWRSGAPRTPFNRGQAAAALWESKWELMVPVVVLGSILGGYATLVEAAALTVVFAFLVECFVYKDLSPRRDIPRVAIECATLIGGFMIILCVALGFTHFLILAQVPGLALSWVQTHIENPLVFLLALNILLILAGALMDIYSAIIVVVPLILPMGAAYGIDSVHLGIIFLANMELGYLMPPMGENLFLSAYRFDQPLTRVYRSTLPYVLILLIAVLLITYLPVLTIGLVDLLVR